MPAETFDRVAVLGPGLIGASIGLALKQRRLAGHVVGLARTATTLDAAVRVGALDAGTQDFDEAVAGADLVIIAAPVLASVELVERLSAHAHRLGGRGRLPLVTDTCSTKAEFVAAAERCLPESVDFCGGHPMAGRETAGPEAAEARLFEGATWVVTPTERTPSAAVTRVSALAEALGSSVLVLSPPVHDRLTASVSHLPHLLAVALALQAAKGAASQPELARVAATGFRDMTRLAAGSAAIWRDVCLTNRESIATALAEMRTELARIEHALDDGTGRELLRLLEDAQSARGMLVSREGGER